jgi:hypothetical protein
VEEFTTMAQVSAELGSIRQNLENRDRLDMDRRKIDDEREADAKRRDAEILCRANDHGGRLRTLEVNWMTFFSENGAFTFVKNQLKDQGRQNAWILGLVVSIFIGLIVDLATKRL